MKGTLPFEWELFFESEWWRQNCGQTRMEGSSGKPAWYAPAFNEAGKSDIDEPAYFTPSSVPSFCYVPVSGGEGYSGSGYDSLGISSFGSGLAGIAFAFVPGSFPTSSEFPGSASSAFPYPGSETSGSINLHAPYSVPTEYHCSDDVPWYTPTTIPAGVGYGLSLL